MTRQLLFPKSPVLTVPLAANIPLVVAPVVILFVTVEIMIVGAINHLREAKPASPKNNSNVCAAVWMLAFCSSDTPGSKHATNQTLTRRHGTPCRARSETIVAKP